MDRQYILDHHMVERYLANRLTGEELDDFESYYVDHPEVMQDLESAARFKLALGELETRNELTTLIKQDSVRWQWYLAAAAIIIAIVGSALLLRNASNAPLMAANAEVLLARTGATTLAGTYEIAQTRGVVDSAYIRLPDSSQVIELRVLVRFTTLPARYRAVLSRIEDDGTSHPIGEVANLSRAPDGRVEIYLASAGLQPGDYAVAIFGADSSGAADQRTVVTFSAR